MTRYVWVVTYVRRDGVATSEITCHAPEAAAELARVLLAGDVQGVDVVTITRRPPLPGEVPNG
jgi:hypothetical protein